jgi:site-specific DNA-methyltransferase (adenine-specific)
VTRTEVIGDATLYLGDCLEILPTLGRIGHVITDPPYSERTHAGHDAGARDGSDKARRADLGYSALSISAAQELAVAFNQHCNGWIVWLTDHSLAPHIQGKLELEGRYVFAPLPFFQAGRSVRLSGDGPCSWTDWIIVSRTAAQHKWGTLRGGYIAGEGWNDKQRMGGKPTRLMQLIVEDYSRFGDTVCDPFMGSGTTGVAALQLGRKFIGIEIDPGYFDIACKRISEAWKQPRLFEEPKRKPQPAPSFFDGDTDAYFYEEPV